VAVVGGGNSALDSALALSKVARQVHVISLSDAIAGDALLKDKVDRAGNVIYHLNAKTKLIAGEKFVTGVTIETKDGAEQTIPVQGVFVEVGYEPSNSFDELTNKNDHGEIIVDKNLETSVPGIFAAGDINDAWGEQIIIAAGEGAKAAMAVSDYLNKIK
jgi:alkyl hydroperoxide reductase subunit F